MDRISNLPIGVIETILCLLPIHEAARTSILSKEWRYHWTKIPKLVFNEDEFEASNDSAEPSVLEQTFDKPSHRSVMTTRCKLFYAVYQVLFMHEGPIHEFTLSMVVDGSCVEIDHLLRHLSKKNTLKILKLEFNGRYMLPLSFFSLHQLTELYLNGCVFERQPASIEFGSLTTLNLQEVFTDEKALMCLLSSSPSLKRLTIGTDGGTIYETGDFTIADLVERLQGVEYLTFWFFLLLCFIPLPKEIPTTLVHLKYLCMEHICFSHIYSLTFIVPFIRSCPNLVKLRLQVSEDHMEDEDYMGSSTLADCSDMLFEQLDELEVLQFSNEENGLVFVKLILAKSPVLKKVRITLWDRLAKDEKLQISNTFLSSPCASPVVQIIVS